MLRSFAFPILLFACPMALAAMEKSDLAAKVVVSAVLRDSMNQMVLTVEKSEQRPPKLKYSLNPVTFIQGWQVFEFYGQVVQGRSTFPVKGSAYVSFTPVFSEGRACTYAFVQELILDRLSVGSDGSLESGLVVSSFPIQQPAGYLDCN